MAVPVIKSIFKSQGMDLAFAIFEALGGNMVEIQQIYKSQMDDILYAILLKLSGGGGGGGTVIWGRLQIRPTDAPGTLYELPEKCFISHAILKSEVTAEFSLEANNSVPGEEVYLFPVTIFDAHIPKVETFAPVIYVPTASKITKSGFAPTELSADIFYTTTTI